MAEIPLLSRYVRFEQWVEELPRAQRSLVMGTAWFVAWFGASMLLGGSSFWSAVSAAAFGAGIFGGLQYVWATRET